MNYDEMLHSIRDERISLAISTCAELYIEQGIDPVKMTDVAERCQIGVASLYRYFGTKQQFTIKVASFIWERQMSLFEGIYDSAYYREKTGVEQVEELLKVFHALLRGHRKFLRFVAAFDAYVLREGIPFDQLGEYEKVVLNSMPYMEAAFEKGMSDGTVRTGVDLRRYYFSVTHSLMSVCQKYAAGDIITSDDEEEACRELLMLIEMYVDYVRAAH